MRLVVEAADHDEAVLFSRYLQHTVFEELDPDDGRT